MKIEKTFIISLPGRLDRLIPLIDYLKSIGFDYSVVSAIKNSDGRKGLILTIEKLFGDILKEDGDIFLILEDDCKFLTNPIDTIEKCFEQLSDDFDMLFLGCNLWQNKVEKYSENLILLQDAYALHSVIYSRNGMAKILGAIHEMKDVVPLDVLIKEKVMVENKCFCSIPMITTQIDSYSDIEKRNTKYSKFLEERFAEKTKHLQ